MLTSPVGRISPATATEANPAQSLAEQASSSREKLAREGYSIRILDLQQTRKSQLTRWTSPVYNELVEDEPCEALPRIVRRGLNPITVVTEFRGKLVGLVSSHIREYQNREQERYIQSVDVSTAHRRKGIAASMLLTLLAANENRPVRLSVWLNNPCNPRALYQRLGFREIFFYSHSATMRRAGVGTPDEQLTVAQRATDGFAYVFMNGLSNDPGDPGPHEPVSMDPPVLDEHGIATPVTRPCDQEWE